MSKKPGLFLNRGRQPAPRATMDAGRTAAVFEKLQLGVFSEGIHLVF